ncbi:MAG: PD-(D/E)XK nuclease family protein [bacterium]
MIQDFPVPTEIFTKYNALIYYDEPHKYYVDNKQLISVTTLIHKYVEEFDEEKWSEIKANEYKLKQREVVRAWKFINKKGTMKGSIIHDYTENLFLNKVFKYPLTEIIAEFGFDPIKAEYDITKNHVDNFYKDCFGKLIPVKTELVVYDPESMIAGMIDMLFYNKKTKKYELWDYKTNKQFSDASENYMLNELFTLQNCDLNIYSLQLGLYKYIIEKTTSIRLGNSYVVWFSHNNENYKIIKLKDLEYFVKLIVNVRINEINTDF